MAPVIVSQADLPVVRSHFQVTAIAPSGSETLAVTACPSSGFRLDRVTAPGSFTSVTVTSTASVSVAVPSLIWTVTS